MFYDFALTIPASTDSAEGYTEELELHYGVITRIEVQFPSGCCGLVSIGLERFARQIIPVNTAGKMRADGQTIIIDCEHDLYDKPHMLLARAWNLDSRYEHTLQVRITVEHKEAGLTAVFSNSELIKALEGG